MSLLRLLDVQVGLHTDANDFTSTPGALRRIQMMGGAESMMARAQTPLSRNDMQSRDGRGFAHLYGPSMLDPPLAPQTEFKGVNGNTGAALASSQRRGQPGVVGCHCALCLSGPCLRRAAQTLLHDRQPQGHRQAALLVGRGHERRRRGQLGV